MVNIGFPYFGFFKQFVQTELNKRLPRIAKRNDPVGEDGNIRRTKRVAWVRVASNAIIPSERLGPSPETSNEPKVDQPNSQKPIKDDDYIKGLVLNSGNFSFNKVYGFGQAGSSIGTTHDGNDVKAGDSGRYRPTPIVESLSITHAGSLGTFRQADIGLRVYTVEQLNIIERSFMNPGITVMVEWGWNDNRVSSQLIHLEESAEMIDTFNDFVVDEKKKLKFIDKKREDSGGNYDVLVGYITNFNYSITPSGEFICNVIISAKGEIYLSLSNYNSQTVKSTDILLQPDTVAPNKDDSIPERLSDVLEFGKFVENVPDQFKDMFFTPTQVVASPKEYQYVSWAFIEDHMLSLANNRIGDLPIFSGFSADGGHDVDFFKIDSSGQTHSAHKNLISNDPTVLLIPNPSSKSFNGIGTAGSSDSDLTINGFTFPTAPGGYTGNIRNLFINVNEVQKALKTQSNIKDFLIYLLGKIEGAGSNMWDFAVVDNVSTISETNTESRDVDDPGIGGQRGAPSFTTKKKKVGVMSVVDRKYFGNGTIAGVESLDKTQIYTFKLLTTDSIVSDFSYSSQLPKEMTAMIIFSRGQYKDGKLGNVIISGESDVASHPFIETQDRVLNLTNSQIKSPPPKQPTKRITSEAEISYESKFIRFLGARGSENFGKSLVFAVTDDQITRSLLFEEEENPDNMYNNNILIPIEMSLTLDGISGITVGDVFKVDGIPEQIKRFGVWQIVGLSHTINNSTWTTEISAKLRVNHIKNVKS